MATSHETVCVLNTGTRVVQHTRLDSRQSAVALLSTVVFAQGGS